MCPVRRAGQSSVYLTPMADDSTVPVDEILELIHNDAREAAARLVAQHPAVARARTADGVSVLLHAVYHGRREIAELLDAGGAERDIFNAAGLGKCERLRELLAADPHAHGAYSSDGWTPLHLAAFFGHVEAVVLLTGRGADVGAVSRNAQANQPLHAACASGRTEAALALIEAGADPGYSAAGYTPLSIAASSGLLPVVQALLARGADPAVVDRYGKTACDYARERGHAAVESFLKGAQAS